MKLVLKAVLDGYNFVMAASDGSEFVNSLLLASNTLL